MNSDQLQALLVDQALGELSEEASALLEAYLSAFPELRVEATRIREALTLTREAVAAGPLLGNADHEGLVVPFPAQGSARGRGPAVPLRAAASVVLLGLALAAGYLAGGSRGGGDRGAVGRGQAIRRDSVADSAVPASSPWARYRVEENGRLAVVLPSDPNS